MRMKWNIDDVQHALGIENISQNLLKKALALKQAIELHLRDALNPEKFEGFMATARKIANIHVALEHVLRISDLAKDVQLKIRTVFLRHVVLPRR